MSTLEGIKQSVNDFNYRQDVSGLSPEAVKEKFATESGFNNIEPVVNSVYEKITNNAKVIDLFKFFHKTTTEKVDAVKKSYAPKIKKASESQSQRLKLKDLLKEKKDVLAGFKLENTLSNTDIESPWLDFTAILAMVLLTVVEMLISYSSLSKYFDGSTQLLFVNGGLGIASSFLATIAGQMITQLIRLKRELREYNSKSASSGAVLPIWVEKNPAVFFDGYEYSLKPYLSIFFIVSFMLFSAVLTIIKFIEPLKAHNTTAFVICGVVMFSNIILFVAYEYITCVGLPYSIWIKISKMLREIGKVEDKLNKIGSLTPEELQADQKKQLEPLKVEYENKYKEVDTARNNMASLEEEALKVNEVINLYITKLSEVSISINLERLLKRLVLPKTNTYVSPF